MKTVIRRYNLSCYEILVVIDALNAKRIYQKSRGFDNSVISELLLLFINALEAYNRLMANGHSGDIVKELSVLFGVSHTTMQIRLYEHGLV